MSVRRSKIDARRSAMVGKTSSISDVGSLIRQLSDRILESTSTTRAVLAWCEEHDLSNGPISAIRYPHVAPAFIEEEALGRLRPLGKPFCYRRVRLVRGALALVDADNWYIPHRLPLGMRDLLQSTDVPFGVIIQSLKPFRRTFRVRHHLVETNFLEKTAREGARSSSPAIIVEHDALIVAENGSPLAVVREQFRAELLNFAFHDRSF